ncbi:MAG: nuclear transport factor 2 family protein [Xanthomonadales bacterium]|nr:nuclear transport factor 2 family protein [Xanthomonadales bacterium]
MQFNWVVRRARARSSRLIAVGPHRLRAALFAVASLAAAGTPWAVAAEPSPADTVFAVERAFAKTMADRDVQAFATFLSDETIFFAGTRPLRGKDAVIEAWSRFYAGPEAPFSWEPDQVEVLDSGTLALSTGPVRDPSGAIMARFQSIWRLEAPGVWRIVFDKGGPPSPGPKDMPGSAAPVAAELAESAAQH